VGNVGAQLDQYNHETASAKSATTTGNTSGTTHDTNTVDGLRGRIGNGSLSSTGPASPTSGPVGAVASTEQAAAMSGPGGLGGFGQSGAPASPTVTGVSVSHSTAAPSTSSATGAGSVTQPAAATPWQTTIQPGAATHPIADLTSPTIGAPLTAPATSVAALFDTHHVVPMSSVDTSAAAATLPFAGSPHQPGHYAPPDSSAAITRLGSPLPATDSATHPPLSMPTLPGHTPFDPTAHGPITALPADSRGNGNGLSKPLGDNATTPWRHDPGTVTVRPGSDLSHTPGANTAPAAQPPAQQHAVLPAAPLSPDVNPSPMLNNPSALTPSAPGHLAPSSDSLSPTDHSLSGNHGLSGGLWSGGLASDANPGWHDHALTPHSVPTHDAGSHHTALLLPH
jgi:hypothetical protein